jgi:GT2 family glycosyltransferase
LAADLKFSECLWSLQQQTRRDFEIVIIDNSGKGAVRQSGAPDGAIIIENQRNVGFGSAVNQAYRRTRAPFLATLNDDAVAHPGWLCALLQAIARRPDVGMCASQVRLFGTARLDSAGMLVGRDGSSKQRGHMRSIQAFPVQEEVLFPSGSAALYRRAMLDEIGPFDEDFFLYCEDTDLGLRARWFGWKCLYVPEAVVEHHYSHSAGRASSLKAYYVERNRLFVLVKNFPAGMLVWSPFVTFYRYCWHALLLLRGRGAAAQFRREGNRAFLLLLHIAQAHAALIHRLPALWRRRRQIRLRAKVTPRVYRRLLRIHSIPARRIAEL